MSYSCPLCHAPLSRSDNHYSCPQRHQFDLAKEGYVNLLPVQFKRSRDPGDSAEMMQARRAFLDAGHYQPLRDAIAERLRHYALRIYWISAVAKGITPTRLPPSPAAAGGWTCRSRRSARRQNATRR
jgi:hypothetical protein